MASITPVARGVILCDYHIGYADGKVDLYGVFNAIRPADGYPYTRGRFCVFATLTNGLGGVPFHLDIRYTATDELVWTTDEHVLEFPDRVTTVHLAYTTEGVRFTRPGVYLVELFCNNTWVCDTLFQLL